MKKLLITFLAVFYLGVSSGATVHFHYCMGQYIDWGFSNEKTDNAENCSNCGMSISKSEDCCKDNQLKFKVKDSLKVTVIAYHAKMLVIDPGTFPDFIETSVPFVKEFNPYSHPVPRTQKTPVFLRNCNFRI